MSPGGKNLAVLGLLYAFAGFGPAQDTAPTSRRERWRFHEVSDPAPSKRSIIAQASESGDNIVVMADGIVVYDVAKTWSSCTEPPKNFREQWVAALPPSALDRIRHTAAAAKAAGRELELIELLDLARVPRAARKKFLGGSAVPIEFWADRHQDSDGSWSPAAFDEHCEGLDHTTCDGFGKDAFRVAATALCSVGYSNFGRPHPSDSPRNDVAIRALRYLITSQNADGGFATANDPSPAMTDACASIALARGAFALSRGPVESRSANASRPTTLNLSDVVAAARNALAHVAVTQNPEGSWGRGLDEAHQLSVTAWSILAIRAGEQALVGSDPAVMTRAVEWIEKIVSAIEAREDAAKAPSDLARARAIRGLARAATGADPAADVTALLAALDASGPATLDAECVLFGTLAAWSIRDDVWESWTRVIKTCVLDTRHVDGCTTDSWTTSSIWSQAGGRVVSTALMSWPAALWYRYPLTFTLRRE